MPQTPSKQLLNRAESGCNAQHCPCEEVCPITIFSSEFKTLFKNQQKSEEIRNINL